MGRRGWQEVCVAACGDWVAECAQGTWPQDGSASQGGSPNLPTSRSGPRRAITPDFKQNNIRGPQRIATQRERSAHGVIAKTLSLSHYLWRAPPLPRLAGQKKLCRETPRFCGETYLRPRNGGMHGRSCLRRRLFASALACSESSFPHTIQGRCERGNAGASSFASWRRFYG